MRVHLRLDTLAIAVLAAVAILAGAASAQTKLGAYASTNRGKIARPPLPNLPSNSTYAIGPLPLYPPDLEPGNGREEVSTYCSICHSTRYITMQPPLPAKTWAAEVTKMEKTLGAPIPDDATKKILEYLQTHYTPATRKR